MSGKEYLSFINYILLVLLRKVGLQIVDLETRDTDMHILAKKCEPVSPVCELSRVRYNMLKAQYLVCKRIPSAYFLVVSWLYHKYLAARDRVLYRKIASIVT
jgi:hypothetical protein